MLYVFQEVPPPIIRSSNCIYSIGYLLKPLLLPATVVEEMELLSSISACKQEQLLLLASCLQTCITCTIAVCTVKNS